MFNIHITYIDLPNVAFGHNSYLVNMVTMYISCMKCGTCGTFIICYCHMNTSNIWKAARLCESLTMHIFLVYSTHLLYAHIGHMEAIWKYSMSTNTSWEHWTWANHSINQWISQSVNHSINQQINQSSLTTLLHSYNEIKQPAWIVLSRQAR